MGNEKSHPVRIFPSNSIWVRIRIKKKKDPSIFFLHPSTKPAISEDGDARMRNKKIPTKHLCIIFSISFFFTFQIIWSIKEDDQAPLTWHCFDTLASSIGQGSNPRRSNREPSTFSLLFAVCRQKNHNSDINAFEASVFPYFYN